MTLVAEAAPVSEDGEEPGEAQAAASPGVRVCPADWA